MTRALTIALALALAVPLAVRAEDDAALEAIVSSGASTAVAVDRSWLMDSRTKLSGRWKMRQEREVCM